MNFRVIYHYLTMATTIDIHALKDALPTTDVVNNYKETEHCMLLYAAIPTCYEELPELPDITGLNRLTFKETVEHYDCLDILHMNGELLEDTERVCDKCNEPVAEQFYHVNYWQEKDGTGFVYDFDLCMNCKDDPRVEKYGMKIPTPNNGMGSVFNWIPVYRDEEYNTILYNAVRDTPFYGKFAMMSVDNHGRLGMYTFEEDISTLKEELEKYYTEWTENYPKDEHSWTKFYDAPIKMVMDERDYEVHYG